MAELRVLERQLEEARKAFATAHDSADPKEDALYQEYLRLQNEFNFASTAEMRQARERRADDLSAADEIARDVIVEVRNQEWNVEGLTLAYFVQRVQETTGASSITADEFRQILGADMWNKISWVSPDSLAVAIERINAMLQDEGVAHDLASSEFRVKVDKSTAPIPTAERNKPKREKAEKRDFYAETTSRLIELIQADPKKWKQPWTTIGSQFPKNMATNNYYQGANLIFLAVSSIERGYTSNYWATFNQIEALGGSVIKGQHGAHVRKWISFDEENDLEPGTQKRAGMVKFYTVFNYQQTTGLSEERFAAIIEDDRTPDERFTEADATIKRYLANGGPRLQFGFDRAYFSPSEDLVAMPNFSAFNSPEDYYQTMFHELSHSTGHSSRLGREGIGGGHQFGSDPYAKEELIAEWGAAFAMARLGMDQSASLEPAAGYVDHWLGVLKEKGNEKLLFDTASAAQKVIEHIGVQIDRGISPSEEKEVGEQFQVDQQEPVEIAFATESRATLDERQASIRNLKRYVQWASLEAPEVFAQHPITDEMCQLRKDLEFAVTNGDSAEAINDRLQERQRELDTLTGHWTNIAVRERLIHDAQSLHADDALKLSEEQAALDEYRSSILRELSNLPESWPYEVIEEFGEEGLIRTAEWRQEFQVYGPEDPFGECEMTEKQVKAREILMARLSQTARDQGFGLAR